jgi:non-heme chloroperoxidase
MEFHVVAVDPSPAPVYHVAGSGIALMQMGNSNLNPVDRGEGRYEEPRPRSVADPRRRKGQHRVVGDRLRLLQETDPNPGVTEIEKMPNRGHSLTIDRGWREVADRALSFIKRFV